MKRPFIAALAAGGLIAAATSAASAAEECRGGYRTLPNDVIVSCSNDAYQAYESDRPYRAYREVPEAPLYTGSIYAERRYYPRPYRYDRPYHRYNSTYYGDYFGGPRWRHRSPFFYNCGPFGFPYATPGACF